MTPEQWKKIENAWNHWFALPSEQRSAYLAQLQQQEPAVAVELQALLAQQVQKQGLSTVDSVGGYDSQPEATTTPEIPQTAGRYVIEEEIGKGGMGAVLRARDPMFDRTLAVKIMLERAHGEPGAEPRFLEEAKITGQLQHPGIPPVHEVGRLDNDLPFFAMKLIKGDTLSELLQQRQTPEQELPRFIGIFGQVCQTIGYAHSRGVLHRDLKPSNIMVGAFGEVQVMDWGLAKLTAKLDEEEDGTITSSTVRSLQMRGDQALSRTGDVMGTPAYMPPEQARGEIRSLDQQRSAHGSAVRNYYSFHRLRRGTLRSRLGRASPRDG